MTDPPPAPPVGRLLHVLHTAERGGVEGNALALIRALPAAGHDVLLLNDGGPMVEAWERAGATAACVGRPGRRPGRIAAAVARQLEKVPPDGAIAWSGVPHLPEIVHACNRAGVPLAAHAGNPARPMPLRVDLRYGLLERLFPPSGPRPTFVCCSRHVADSFAAGRFLRRFPRTVVPNGVPPSGAPAEVRPFDPARPFTIGMTARLDAIKDHATLLRAFAAVAERFPNARLELAGDGETRPALEALAAGLGLGDAIRFLGDVGDVPAALRRWDLFAYATTPDEGLGNAVAEALTAGLPCVVTEIGPMREFFEQTPDGPTVRLVPPADPPALAAALIELIPDQAARARLATAGRAFAEQKFGLAAFARGYLAALGLPAGFGSSPAPTGGAAG